MAHGYMIPEMICVFASLISLMVALVSLASITISYILFRHAPTDITAMTLIFLGLTIFDLQSEWHHRGIKHAIIRFLITIIFVLATTKFVRKTISRFVKKYALERYTEKK